MSQDEMDVLTRYLAHGLKDSRLGVFKFMENLLYFLTNLSDNICV